MSSRPTPTLSEAIRFAIESRLADVHVALPGVVQRYYINEGSADIELKTARPLRTQKGERALERLPLLPRVPIAMLEGGGNFVDFELEQGDTVFVVFADYTVSRWVDTGSDDPEIDTPHTLAGALAYPVSFKRSAPFFTDLTLGRRNGKRIQTTDQDVRIGSENAVDFAAVARLVDQRFADLKIYLDTHIHGTSMGNSTPPVAPSPSPSTVASTVVKIE